MFKRMSVSFHDEIMHIISVFTLLPLCLVAVSFFIFSYIYFDTVTLAQNRSDNREIAGVFGDIISIYEKKLHSESFDFDVEELKNDSSMSRYFLSSMIQFMNYQGHSADFYLFDSDFKTVTSSSSMLISFVPPDTGKNWGIANKLNQSPGKVCTAFFHGDFLIGRGIKNGFAIFSVPRDFFDFHVLEKESSVLILNRYNDVCLASSSVFTGSFNSVKSEVLLASRFFKFQKNWYFKTASSVGFNDDRLIIFTFSSIRRMVLALILEGFALLLIIVVTGWLCYSRAMRAANGKMQSIGKIVAALEQVQNGNFKCYMKVEADDEFGMIAESFNMMTESINNLIKKNAEISRETVAAQIRQLESQFNPHFLFNTLELIKYMAKLDSDNVAPIINSLCKLLRYSINIDGNDITLAEDMEHTKNYLSIQKFRFTQRFNYSVKIEESCLDCIVPKLILQPLIENSLQHTLLGGGGKKVLEVEIVAFEKDGKICISVKDNGDGMDSEKLAELGKMLMQETQTSNHLGLYNINRRLVLLHGKKAGFEIESSPGHGTIVTMTFPAIHRNC